MVALAGNFGPGLRGLVVELKNAVVPVTRWFAHRAGEARRDWENG